MRRSKALVGAAVAAALSLIHHGAMAQDQLELDPMLDRQTIRLLIANSNEMAQRPDVAPLTKQQLDLLIRIPERK